MVGSGHGGSNMSKKIVVSVTPGVAQNVPLNQGLTAKVIDISNGTPFELDYHGFGVSGDIVLSAGLMYRFFREINNDGFVRILAVNNNNVNGTGVVNITVYDVGDLIPEGTYPVTVPVQVVQATVTSLPFLDNEGNAAGTQIIKSIV